MASDSEVPGTNQEKQHPKDQEESRPSVAAIPEARYADDGGDTATGKTREAQPSEVAVLECRDQALQAGS